MKKLLAHLALHWNTLTWVSSKQSLYIWLAAILMAGSRVLLTMSFFLPIKLLIVLSSDKPPVYMNYLPSAISYQSWIIILMIMVPILYISSIITSLLSSKYLEKTLADVGDDTQKHKAVNAKLAIKAKVPFLSNVLVVSVGLLILLLLNWMFFLWVLLFIISLAYLMEMVLLNNLDQPKVTLFNVTRNQFVDYCSGFSYIIVFGMLALLVIISNFNVFAAILSLLLVRLIVQALQRFFKSWIVEEKTLKNLKITNIATEKI